MNANKQDAGGLPEPYATIAGHGDVYTADQLRAYGEQCRAASGFELLELAAIFESCVPFLPPVGQKNITKAVAELRVLSRGAPEGK